MVFVFVYISYTYYIHFISRLLILFLNNILNDLFDVVTTYHHVCEVICLEMSRGWGTITLYVLVVQHYISILEKHILEQIANKRNSL